MLAEGVVNSTANRVVIANLSFGFNYQHTFLIAVENIKNKLYR